MKQKLNKILILFLAVLAIFPATAFATPAWNFTSSSYDSVSKTAEPKTQGMFFKPDGTVLYLASGDGSPTVKQYPLTTAWDLSSLGSNTGTFSLSGSSAYWPVGIYLSPNGLRMYIYGENNDRVYQYALSSAWDITSASSVNSVLVSSQSTYGSGLYFKPDGTKMYISDQGTERVYQYSLSTAWDITTTTYDSVNVSFFSLFNLSDTLDIAFKDNGTMVYFVGDDNTGNSIAGQVALTTAWSLSSTGSTTTISLNSQNTNSPRAMFVGRAGTKLYSSFNFSTSQMYQYSIQSTTTPATTITAPTDHTTVSSTVVTLAAEAYDDSSVSSVKFYIDGSLVGTDNSSPYSVAWDSTSVADGSKTLEAVVTDDSSNVATSSPYTITVSNDLTVPTVSITAPSNGSSVSGNSVTFSANASDNLSVAGVKFYVGNSLISSEDTSSPYGVTWNTASSTSGSKTLVAVARDSAGNVATSSSVTITVANEPTPSSLSASASSTSATISWLTNSAASSRIYFGIASTVASSTPETDTSPRVASHSVTLGRLVPCSTYSYLSVSTNAGGDTATSSQSTLSTEGCTGSATITGNTETNIATSTGGSLNFGSLSLTVPANFTSTSSSATFQASTLATSTFTSVAGSPSGVNRVSSIYHLKAFSNESTTLTTFNQPITVTIAYSAGDISGISETSLIIYRYNGSSWSQLNSCSVNTSADTISCFTTAFSDFAIFGETTSSTPTPSSSGGGGLPPAAYAKPMPPLGGFVIAVTPFSKNLLKVSTNAGQDVKNIALSLNANFENTGLIPYSQNLIWSPCPAYKPCLSELATVYAKFYTDWGQQSEVYSTKASLQTSQNKAVNSTLNMSKAVSFSRNLQKGSKGADVAMLQTFLSGQSGLYPENLITGNFGLLTLAAVKKFQIKYGITAGGSGFGIVGPLTRTKLNKLLLNK